MPHFTWMIFLHHTFQSFISEDMSHVWHVAFTAILCSGVLWAAAKPQWQHNPSAIQTFFPQIFPVWVVFSHQQRDIFQRSPAWPSAPRAQQKWARHQRSHQEHITNAEDPLLELKGQLQFFPKCPTPPLALLPLPTQNQSP